MVCNTVAEAQVASLPCGSIGLLLVTHPPLPPWVVSGSVALWLALAGFRLWPAALGAGFWLLLAAGLRALALLLLAAGSWGGLAVAGCAWVLLACRLVSGFLAVCGSAAAHTSTFGLAAVSISCGPACPS